MRTTTLELAVDLTKHAMGGSPQYVIGNENLSNKTIEFLEKAANKLDELYRKGKGAAWKDTPEI